VRDDADVVIKGLFEDSKHDKIIYKRAADSPDEDDGGHKRKSKRKSKGLSTTVSPSSSTTPKSGGSAAPSSTTTQVPAKGSKKPQDEHTTGSPDGKSTTGKPGDKASTTGKPSEGASTTSTPGDKNSTTGKPGDKNSTTGKPGDKSTSPAQKNTKDVDGDKQEMAKQNQAAERELLNKAFEATKKWVDWVRDHNATTWNLLRVRQFRSYVTKLTRRVILKNTYQPAEGSIRHYPKSVVETPTTDYTIMK